MADGHTPATFAPTAPALRPGERLVAGKPYIFDLDAVTAHEADKALAAAPADLSRLSWAELGDLHSQWINASYRRRAEVAEIGSRICAERARRPEYAVFCGGAV